MLESTNNAPSANSLLPAVESVGAEFTQEFADAFGQKVQPKAHAVRVELKEVAPGESHEEIATGRPRATGRWKD